MYTSMYTQHSCLLYSSRAGDEMQSNGKLSRKYDLGNGGEVVLSTGKARIVCVQLFIVNNGWGVQVRLVCMRL